MTGNRTQERFDEAHERLVNAANTAGIDPGVMIRIAGFESHGYNPEARPVSSRHPELNTVRQFDGTMAMSTAYGYGQFLDGTWQDMVNRHGERYGIEGASTMTREQANSPELRNNRDLQAGMLAEFTRENLERIAPIAGPNADANVYAMHNLGGRDGPDFLRAMRDNPDALVSANGLLSSNVISRNPSLYMDGDRVLTVREAYGRMGEQLAPYQQYSDQVGERAQTTPGVTPPAPARTAADPLADGALSRGERGEPVRHLQEQLVTLGTEFKDSQGRPLAPTGVYAQQTETAVRNFQGSNNLPPTGVADEATRTAIDAAAAQRRTAPDATPALNPGANPNPAPAGEQPATPAQPARTTGPQSFDDVMRVMLPPQAGTTPHMTSDFGPRTLNGQPSNHGGVDFNYVGGQNGTNLEHPTVRSPVSGEVVFSGGQYGTVKIRDDQGNMHEILHMDSRSVQATNPPTRVEAGDSIGTMGGRGPNGSGQYAQHVHYQMRDPSGNLIDPEAHWNNPQRTQGREDPATQPRQAPAETPAAEGRTPAAANIAPAVPARSEAMADGVLREREHGPEVERFQRILADQGYRGADGKSLEVDGKFGPNTRHAVTEFQRDHDIDRLGVIGPKTQAALETSERQQLTNPGNEHNGLYKQMLGRVEETEAARGIPKGDHSSKLAAALTVEAIREGVTQVDRVDLNRDGTMARAVQFSQMGDKPELNRNTDAISTQQATQQPVRESSEQAQQVANNVRMQQTDDRQQAQAMSQGGR
ncbi:MAG: peptidoglycan-binding protein [Lysobacteraceae bacterium]